MTLLLRARWQSLAPHSRRWVLWQFVFGAALVNAGLNALIAWLLTRQQDAVSFAGIPVIDKTTVLVDTLATLFVLPFLTTLVVTTVVRKELEGGELKAPAVVSARLPSKLLRRAALIGLACFVALAIPVVLVLSAVGSPDMTVDQFIAFKAIFGAIYGLPVTPAIALLAMRN